MSQCLRPAWAEGWTQVQATGTRRLQTRVVGGWGRCQRWQRGGAAQGSLSQHLLVCGTVYQPSNTLTLRLQRQSGWCAAAGWWERSRHLLACAPSLSELFLCQIVDGLALLYSFRTAVALFSPCYMGEKLHRFARRHQVPSQHSPASLGFRPCRRCRPFFVESNPHLVKLDMLPSIAENCWKAAWQVVIQHWHDLFVYFIILCLFALRVSLLALEHHKASGPESSPDSVMSKIYSHLQPVCALWYRSIWRSWKRREASRMGAVLAWLVRQELELPAEVLEAL